MRPPWEDVGFLLVIIALATLASVAISITVALIVGDAVLGLVS